MRVGKRQGKTLPFVVIVVMPKEERNGRKRRERKTRMENDPRDSLTYSHSGTLSQFITDKQRSENIVSQNTKKLFG